MVQQPLPTHFTIELEQEADGRWIAEVLELPGALVYSDSREAAIAQVQALALRVIADRLEHGELRPVLHNLIFLAA